MGIFRTKKITNFSSLKKDIEKNFLYACKYGKFELVKFLLYIKLKQQYLIYIASSMGDKAFRLACKYGHIEVINILHPEEGRVFEYDTYKFVFKDACENGRLEVVRLLLDIEKRSQFIIPSKHEAFIAACKNGHIEVVKLLLELDGEFRIDVHAEDQSGFRYACENNHMEIVKLLLDLKGDRKIDIHAEDEHGFLLACEYGHLELVKFLLSLEGDRRINIHTVNVDAFRLACENNYTEIMELLLTLQGEPKIVKQMIKDAFIETYEKYYDYKYSSNVENSLLYLLDIDDERRIDEIELLGRACYCLIEKYHNVAFKIIKFNDERKINLTKNILHRIYNNRCYYIINYLWEQKDERTEFMKENEKELFYHYKYLDYWRNISCDNPESFIFVKNFLGDKYKLYFENHSDYPSFDLWTMNNMEDLYWKNYDSLINLFHSIKNTKFNIIKGIYSENNGFYTFKKRLYERMLCSTRNVFPFENAYFTLLHKNTISDIEEETEGCCNGIINESIWDVEQCKEYEQKLDLHININDEILNRKCTANFKESFIFHGNALDKKEHSFLYEKLVEFINDIKMDYATEGYAQRGSGRETIKNMDFEIQIVNNVILAKFKITKLKEHRVLCEGTATDYIGCYIDLERL